MFERHRAPDRHVKYEVSVRIYGKNSSRQRVPSTCLKRLSVREDVCFDVFQEALVFEACDTYDNYIMVIDLVPQALRQALDPAYNYANARDPLMSAEAMDALKAGRMPARESVMMSLSLYCWYDADLAVIPFRELAQKQTFEFYNLRKVMIELTVVRSAEFEFRVRGRLGKSYKIVVAKATGAGESLVDGSDSDQGDEPFIRHTGQNDTGNILVCELTAGSYLAYFIEAAPAKKSRSCGAQKKYLKLLKSKFCDPLDTRYAVGIHAYGQNYASDYASSVRRIESKQAISTSSNGVLSQLAYIDQMYFHAGVVRRPELAHTRCLSGKWTPTANRPARRFNVRGPQDFHFNPGFVISPDGHCQLLLRVVPKNAMSRKKQYKVCLYSISADFGLESIEESEYVLLSRSYVSGTLCLPKNANGYLLVLVPRSVDVVADFEITAKSDTAIADIRSSQRGVCNWGFARTCDGVFRKWQGGTIKAYRFFLNSHWIIYVQGPESGGQRTASLYLELRAKTKSKSHIGLYVFRIKLPKKLHALSPPEISQIHSNRVFLPDFASLHVQVSPGHHMIVPTTFTESAPGEQLEFQLKVHSTRPIDSVTEHSPQFERLIRRQIRSQFRAKLHFRVDCPDVTLVVVVEGAESECQSVDFVLGRVWLGLTQRLREAVQALGANRDWLGICPSQIGGSGQA